MLQGRHTVLGKVLFDNQRPKWNKELTKAMQECEVLTAVVMNAVNCSTLIFWLSDSEDGGDTFLRNVGSHIDYTALYLRRW
jgi:hypothetical protein